MIFALFLGLLSIICLFLLSLEKKWHRESKEIRAEVHHIGWFAISVVAIALWCFFLYALWIVGIDSLFPNITWFQTYMSRIISGFVVYVILAILYMLVKPIGYFIMCFLGSSMLGTLGLFIGAIIRGPRFSGFDGTMLEGESIYVAIGLTVGVILGLIWGFWVRSWHDWYKKTHGKYRDLMSDLEKL